MPAEVSADLHRIEMVPFKVVKASLQKCKPDQFALVHWTAKLAKTNKLVEDTKKTYGKENPKEIWIGHRSIVRCLELTVAQMKPGDVFDLNCPS